MKKDQFIKYANYIAEWRALNDPFDPCTAFGTDLMTQLLEESVGDSQHIVRSWIRDQEAFSYSAENCWDSLIASGASRCEK